MVLSCRWYPIRRASPVSKNGKQFSRGPLPALPTATYAHCQLMVGDDALMVFGGCVVGDRYANIAMKLDMGARRSWEALPNLPTGRYAPACGVVRDGRVVVAGGRRPVGPITDRVDILDLATKVWTRGIMALHIRRRIILF